MFSSCFDSGLFRLHCATWCRCTVWHSKAESVLFFSENQILNGEPTRVISDITLIWHCIQQTLLWCGNLKPPVHKQWEWTVLLSRRHLLSSRGKLRKRSISKYIYSGFFNQGEGTSTVFRISCGNDAKNKTKQKVRQTCVCGGELFSLFINTAIKLLQNYPNWPSCPRIFLRLLTTIESYLCRKECIIVIILTQKNNMCRYIWNINKMQTIQG